MAIWGSSHSSSWAAIGKLPLLLLSSGWEAPTPPPEQLLGSSHSSSWAVVGKLPLRLLSSSWEAPTPPQVLLLLLLLRPGDAAWGSNALPACCARSKISWIAPRTFLPNTSKICPNIGRRLCFRWPWTFWQSCQIFSIHNRSIEFATCSQNSMNVPGIVWPGPD